MLNNIDDLALQFTLDNLSNKIHFMENEIIFSVRLSLLREELGISKKDVAQKLNIDQSTYGKYELSKRQPDYDTLLKLASFFNVSVDYLLGRTENRTSDNINDYKPDNAKAMLRDIAKLTDEQKEIVNRLMKEFLNEKK